MRGGKKEFHDRIAALSEQITSRVSHSVKFSIAGKELTKIIQLSRECLEKVLADDPGLMEQSISHPLHYKEKVAVAKLQMQTYAHPITIHQMALQQQEAKKTRSRDGVNASKIDEIIGEVHERVDDKSVPDAVLDEVQNA